MRSIIFSAILIAVSFCVNGQSWELTSSEKISDLGQKDIKPTIFRVFDVNNEELLKKLRTAPQEGTVSDALKSQVIITVGMPNGKIENFSLVKYNLLDAALQAQFPDILAFYGVGTSDPNVRIVADYSPTYGFRAVVYYPDGDQVYIDHYQRSDLNHRIVYNRKDIKAFDRWTCLVDESKVTSDVNRNSSFTGDCVFREYRLALACTGEYAAFHGGTTAGALAAMNTTMNRINGVFAQELAIRFTIIANNNLIIYLNGATDPYTNDDGEVLLVENQANIDAVIGNANYDVGHVFSTGGGGIAQLQSPCFNGEKAMGVTGAPAPTGDPFDIDYVAHEMGHQLGGNHTQNNSCQRNSTTSMEPGSASSIMGYAGICSPNVALNSDPNYHAISLQEIKSFLGGAGSNCDAPVSGYVNSPPSISAPSNGTNYKIPISTPFALTMTATDPNGHSILYGWDQMDNAVGTMPILSTNSVGPMFRFLSPTTNPSRNFPNLMAILAGATAGANYSGNNWEVLPSVARNMNFRGVARDITPMSASCNSEVNVSVSTIAGTTKFEITTDNAATPSWITGATRTVTWSVGGTTANGINCAAVDILWTTNGGATWTTLVSDVPNDGSQEIIAPSTTTTGRYMVRARGNVFFDINNTNITVTTTGSTPTFNIQLVPWYEIVCTGQSKNYTVSVSSFSGYVTPVTLSLVGLPAGFTASFSINPVTPGSTSILTVTNNTAAVATSVVGLNGVSGPINKTTNFSLTGGGGLGAFTLSSPANNATGIALKPTFTWTAAANAVTYEFQLSRKSDFSNILISTINLTTLTYTLPTLLVGFSEYFWRVRAINVCGNGVWQSFKFETEPCFFYNSTNVPLTISASGTPMIFSNLTVQDKGIISDVDVTNLSGNHTYISDLIFKLNSPQVNDTIMKSVCTNQDNFNINFDQSSSNLYTSIPCPPVNAGTYRPYRTLAVHSNGGNKPLKGVWQMEIKDLFDTDGGQLNTWGIRACATNFCRLTVDNDAEKGAGSLLAAINCAANGDTIRFASTFMNDTITLFNSNIVTNKRIFIDADPAKNIHITSTSTSPTIVSSTPNTLEGLKIRGLHIHSSASIGVGAIQNSGLLNMVDVTLYKGTSGAPSTIRNDVGGVNNLSGSCKVLP